MAPKGQILDPPPLKPMPCLIQNEKMFTYSQKQGSKGNTESTRGYLNTQLYKILILPTLSNLTHPPLRVTNPMLA